MPGRLLVCMLCSVQEAASLWCLLFFGWNDWRCSESLGRFLERSESLSGGFGRCTLADRQWLVTEGLSGKSSRWSPSFGSAKQSVVLTVAFPVALIVAAATRPKSAKRSCVSVSTSWKHDKRRPYHIFSLTDPFWGPKFESKVESSFRGTYQLGCQADCCRAQEADKKGRGVNTIHE